MVNAFENDRICFEEEVEYGICKGKVETGEEDDGFEGDHM